MGFGCVGRRGPLMPLFKDQYATKSKKKRNYEKMIEKNDPLKYDLHLNHVPFEFEVDER